MKVIPFLIGLLMLNVSLSFGQTEEAVSSSPQERYLQQPIQTHQFDTATWRNLSSKLDYSEEKVQPKANTPEDPEKADRFATFVKFLLIAVAVAIVVFIIVKMASGEPVFSRKNRSLKPIAGNINLEKIEENLHEADLHDPIRQAVAAGDYTMAVRLYYLAVLKELSLKKLIHWKKDKTNGEYLRELAGSHHFTAVREATLIFERVWYGKTVLQETDFLELENKFKKTIGMI